ncbi:MAG: YkgJ family cysteine cluster protein [Candidatus Nanoarchaeia archaeon]|jgi:Fe-S-cluster containining protein
MKLQEAIENKLRTADEKVNYSCLPGCNSCCNMHKHYGTVNDDAFISWIKGFDDFEEFGFSIKNSSFIMPKTCLFNLKNYIEENCLRLGRKNASACAIYEKRPQLCREYSCELSEIINEYDKKTGFKNILREFYSGFIFENDLENYLAIMPEMIRLLGKKNPEKISLDFVIKYYRLFEKNVLPHEKRIAKLKNELSEARILIESGKEELRNEFKNYCNATEFSGCALFFDDSFYLDAYGYAKNLFWNNSTMQDRELLADKIFDLMASDYSWLTELLDTNSRILKDLMDAKEKKEKGIMQADSLFLKKC